MADIKEKGDGNRGKRIILEKDRRVEKISVWNGKGGRE